MPPRFTARDDDVHTTRKLAQYVRECRTLRQDLSELISDLRRQQERPGSIVYAADFAEVFSYIFPDLYGDHLRLFAEEDTETVLIHQKYAMQKLFGADSSGQSLTCGNLALLPPYSEELAMFIRHEGARAMRTVADSAAAANVELAHLLSDAEFGELVERATALLDASPDAQEAAAPALVEYFEKHAPTLTRLVTRAGEANARERLGDLLESGRLRGIDQWTAPDVPLDQALIDRWDADLFRRRRNSASSASLLDARAVATIRAANARLASSGVRLFLITRSSLMHDLMRQEMVGRLWPEWDESPLRDPRFLIPLHVVEGKSPVEQLVELEDLRKSVGLFVETYQYVKQDVRPDDFEPEMAEIRARLQKSTGLSAWLEASRSVSQDIGGSARERLNVLLDVSTKDAAFASSVVNRIAALEDEMARLYRYSGLSLYRAELKGVGGVLENGALQAEFVEDGVEIRAFRPELLYRLRFDSAELKEWAQRLAQHEDIDLNDLLALFRRSWSSGEDYEMLLFMACIFGALQQWSLATDYCRVAISKHTAEDPPATEAYFMLGVSLRMDGLGDSQRYHEALDSLRTAARLASLETGGADDARVLKELAALIFIWHADFAAGRHRGLDEPPVAADEAVDLSERALAALEADDPLRKQILNNLCFHFVSGTGMADAERAEFYLAELKSVLTAEEPERRNWAPAYIDTVVWGEFRVAQPGTLEGADYVEMLDLLEQVVRDPRTPTARLEEVGDHREAIEIELRKVA